MLGYNGAACNLWCQSSGVLNKLFGDLAVVVDSHGVVIRLPREVLFGIRVDAYRKSSLWEVNVVD